MLVRRRDCDCLLLAWLAASGGLARHRLSDASAPSPLPLPTTLPLSLPLRLSHHFSTTTCSPSTFLALYSATYFSYFSLSLSFSSPPSLCPLSPSISVVLLHSPPSVSLNHTYGLSRFTYSAIGSYLLSLSPTFYVFLVLSLICSRFVFLSLSLSLSLSIVYRATMYSLTNSDSLKFSLSLFHSPFRNPLALSFSPYLRRIFRPPSCSVVCTNFRDTHRLVFSLSLSLILPILSAFPFLAHSPLSLSRHRLSSFSLLSPTTRSQGSPPPHNMSCPSRPSLHPCGRIPCHVAVTATTGAAAAAAAATATADDEAPTAPLHGSISIVGAHAPIYSPPPTLFINRSLSLQRRLATQPAYPATRTGNGVRLGLVAHRPLTITLAAGERGLVNLSLPSFFFALSLSLSPLFSSFLALGDRTSNACTVYYIHRRNLVSSCVHAQEKRRGGRRINQGRKMCHGTQRAKILRYDQIWIVIWTGFMYITYQSGRAKYPRKVVTLRNDLQSILFLSSGSSM